MFVLSQSKRAGKGSGPIHAHLLIKAISFMIIIIKPISFLPQITPSTAKLPTLFPFTVYIFGILFLVNGLKEF